jgi:alkanesulfonate monooxygenase
MLTTPGPKFGVFLPSVIDERPPSLEALCAYAERAEALGLDSLWVIDHLFRAAPSYKVTWLEPLTVLTAVAARTRRATLGTGILVLPIRDPVILAKQVASLDVLTGGRVILGVGTGWNENEFAACRIPYAERGGRAEEIIELLKRLWTEERVTFEGRYYRVRDVTLEPRPVQRPHPPIWIGGGVWYPDRAAHLTDLPGYRPAAVLRRVARLGDGHFPSYRAMVDSDMTHVRRAFERVRAVAREYGRDPAGLTLATQEYLYLVEGGSRGFDRARAAVARFTPLPFEEARRLYLLGTPDEVVRMIRARLAAGVQHVTFCPIVPDPAQLELLARRVLPRVRAALRPAAHGRPSSGGPPAPGGPSSQTPCTS